MILLIFSTGFAGAREVDPELVEAASGIGKRCALVIGVEYVGNNALKWTVDDAVEIGWLLEREFGFEVTCAFRVRIAECGIVRMWRFKMQGPESGMF